MGKKNSKEFANLYLNQQDSEENNDKKESVDNYEDQQNPNSRIKEMGSVITNSKGNKIYCLTVIGQIEGHDILPSKNKATKYEHVIPRLVSVEEDPNIDGMLMLLNTVGGDVEAGLAMAELIAGMKKPTVSVVLGGGHSIGVPLAVSAKKSFIVKSATMTLHPVRSTGITVGAPQAFEYFEKMQQRITRFVSDNSGMSSKRFYELVMNTKELVMDVGSVLDGDKAVDEGLIDYIGSLSDALECLYDMIEKQKSSYKSSYKSEDKRGYK